ncbi:MAG: tRNA (adenosine(37)-N6)-dimethylallyltransferase MiaA [Muribaculaceae bacterium]|nr:tRNA (adenosine(37)-N6)-dimethylallyltransferase MiaA [Muribaculaceae bacterium]
MKKGKVTVITGPTASGKSALAIEMALKRNLEIISADSRQIYKGIPISTAMPSDEELSLVRHHLIGELPLDAYYSAAMFEEQALEIARRQIEERGEVILCGGSMMYVDAFCRGIDDIPTVSEKIRRETQEEAAERGDDWARMELLRLDPEYHSIVDLRNIKRVVHAIEIIRESGMTFTSFRRGVKKEREFEIEMHFIDMPRDVLFERINRRVDLMVEAGLIEEAERVYPMRHLNSLNTVGLKELFAWKDGAMDLSTAIERIKKNTRVYAKKQLTWHARRMKNDFLV